MQQEIGILNEMTEFFECKKRNCKMSHFENSIKSKHLGGICEIKNIGISGEKGGVASYEPRKKMAFFTNLMEKNFETLF